MVWSYSNQYHDGVNAMLIAISVELKKEAAEAIDARR